MTVLKSFPLAGPRLSSISSIWSLRALMSFMIMYPAMYWSASSAFTFLPRFPMTMAASSSKSSLWK
jgi:hypothetical protein